ncbi:hypothetical protein P3X46_019812 [Hevea brasiliensis]|uniref:RNA polymerase sigma-70 domain-containing protein n=1 Tax=Hevea brasiliensis TaxID=3981 RepID=A0ABQ9LNZ0_HEVBR|nr:hypothetical protein P3X46_019812 [Hevea brasiliensis]
MGVGYRLSLKCGFFHFGHSLSPIHYPGSRLLLGSFNLTRLSFLSVISEEGDILCRVLRLCFGSHSTIEDDIFVPLSSSKERTSRFGLLLENLIVMEESFADSDALKLERDILLQLGRIGAVKLFNKCLTSTHKATCVLDLPYLLSILRKRASSKNGCIAPYLSLPSKPNQNGPGNHAFCSANKASNSKSRRLVIARNEADMSRGVKLIRSTRLLVLYFARNYRGMGIGLEGLLQCIYLAYIIFYFSFPIIQIPISFPMFHAGNLGVLQGAERFDHTRGCRFSTYVLYWIRNQSLRKSHGKFADDSEIAKFTGLSLAKIESASKCLKKRQVLVLRYGLKDQPPKSLEEIGKLFHVSKEWVRRLQKKVMTRLRSDENCGNLRHYMNL